MDNVRPGGVNRRPSPQLPAFCRSRQPISTVVRLSSLQQLHGLLWLVLILQLCTVLLVLAGPVPAPRRSSAGPRTIPEAGPRAVQASTTQAFSGWRQ